MEKNGRLNIHDSHHKPTFRLAPSMRNETHMHGENMFDDDCRNIVIIIIFKERSINTVVVSFYLLSAMNVKIYR